MSMRRRMDGALVTSAQSSRAGLPGRAGRGYARAVIAVTAELNREVAARVSPAQLAAADTVLRAALFDDSARQRASQLPAPPGQPPG